jgi:L-ribulose-5-phosphate 3-epimerase
MTDDRSPSVIPTSFVSPSEEGSAGIADPPGPGRRKSLGVASRREFLSAAATAGAVALGPGRAVGAPAPAAAFSVSVFSKHLPYLDYRALAETAAEAGFDGIDLTVRPAGHVLPERVTDDLPKAVEAARAAGVSVPMMTTALTSTRDPYAEAILRTAGRLGIRDYRLGSLDYSRSRGILGTLDALRAPLRDLAALNEGWGIRGGYQNHAGERVGAAVWDLWLLLRDVGSPWLGCQYDVRHAIIEGGTSWVNGLRLIAPFIHTLDVKDGHWAKTDVGWQALTVPLGEGVVDLVAFFRLLAEVGVRAPISMHFEYPFPEEGGPAERRRAAVALMRRDRERLRSAMAEAAAGGAARP